MGKSNKPLFVRMAQCQEVFGVHRATFYRWAADGLITIHKRGAISLLKVSEVEAFLEGREQLSQS